MLVTNEQGKLIKKVKNIRINESVNMKFYDGLAVANIKSKKYEDKKK